MFLEFAISFSELIAESVITTSIIVFTLRLILRFASFLASRPWRRYRTFTIRRRRWRRKKTAEEESQSQFYYCTICLQDGEDGEKMRKITTCSHCFHADCIDPWLEKKSTCPLCRAEIPPAPPGNPILALFVPPGVIELFTKGTFPSD